MESLRRGVSWAVHFDVAAGQFRVLSADDDDGNDATSDGDWTDGDETAYSVVNLSDYRDISFGSAYGTNGAAEVQAPHVGAGGPANHYMVFQRDGTVTDQNGAANYGTVYVRNSDGRTFAVGITSAVGNVKSWHHYGAGWKE